MRPLILRPGLPQSLDALAIDYASLVVPAAPLTEDEHPYLASIARYSNRGGAPDGLFAHSFRLAPDPAFDELLGMLHALPVLHREFVARLLARTRARDALTEFAHEPDELERRLREAAFTYVSPFALPGTLAEYLFRYGMYSFYYDDHHANDARDEAQSLLRATVGDDIEQVVAFESHLPWGEWFDPHGCTDRTFVMLQRERRALYVLAFTHSD